MYEPYLDIRRRLGEPLWHDSNGVPRYAPYRPGMQDVYAHYECLLEIRCQGCGRTFMVGACAQTFAVRLCPHGHAPDVVRPALPTATDPGVAGFGDAPWHETCGGMCAGCTMSTEPLRVVEFWERDAGRHWTRVPEREVT